MGIVIPAMENIKGVIFFLIGSKWFKLQPPGGSTITRICQVIIAVSRKFGLYVPDYRSLF